MKQPIHIEQHYLGIALLCCILGYIALAALGKVQNDSTLTNLAFALAGGLAGATLPRSGAGATVLNNPTDTTVNAGTGASDSPSTDDAKDK